MSFRHYADWLRFVQSEAFETWTPPAVTPEEAAEWIAQRRAHPFFHMDHWPDSCHDGCPNSQKRSV